MWTWLKRIALCALILVVAAIGTGWWLMRGSLPTLEGTIAINGLSAPVSVQRDALGTVTIDAANEADAMRALGYVHGQERYFEMDLLRRTAAGELSELFGPIALDLDKSHRTHRIRARVDARLADFSGAKQPQLDAYIAGVNAGLAALPVRPWPYLLLRQQPKAWTATDSALSGYAMYFDLQDASNRNELAMMRIKPHLPPALYGLIARDGTHWDAPLIGEARSDAILPSATEINLRTLPGPIAKQPGALSSSGAPGSNNFAVGGAITRDGRAIVADDMHLGLRAPDLWFRARLRYADPRAPGGKVDVTGFTLPGLPAVVVGSNTHVAWAFTNSYIDSTDWRRETRCTAAATNTDCVQPMSYREMINVAGQAPVALNIDETAWGPVLHRDTDGTLLTLRWNAHLAGALNLGLSDFAHAGTLTEAMSIADHSAIPTQNLLVGDAEGHIGWRLLGPLPDRHCSSDLSTSTSTSASAPTSTTLQADARNLTTCAPWQITTDHSPSVINPSNHRLWSANNRVADGSALAQIGDGGYALGARAQQIRDDLLSKPTLGERDLLAIQLDDRAIFLTPWWRLLHEQASASRSTSPALTALAKASQSWEGHASVESVSYRIVRAWRLAVHARIAEGLTAPAQAALGDDFVMPNFGQLEGIAWPLITQRPQHLLSRRYQTWDALLEDAAKQVRDDLGQHGPLAQRTWGERNTAAICHPLARAIPLLGKRLLCMPPDQLPGDGAMPRVQSPDFGASERMVVAPGHETDGIAHMPGGQSGHPFSPFWGAGHEDWVHGRPSAFLPGTSIYRLELKPAITSKK